MARADKPRGRPAAKARPAKLPSPRPKMPASLMPTRHKPKERRAVPPFTPALPPPPRLYQALVRTLTADQLIALGAVVVSAAPQLGQVLVVGHAGEPGEALLLVRTPDRTLLNAITAADHAAHLEAVKAADRQRAELEAARAAAARAAEAAAENEGMP